LAQIRAKAQPKNDDNLSCINRQKGAFIGNPKQNTDINAISSVDKQFLGSNRGYRGIYRPYA
jgi:hypothetical protein